MSTSDLTPEALGESVAAQHRPDQADRYDRILHLADLFDRTGEELRSRARLGDEVLRDPDVAESAELSRATWAQAEADIRAATTGKHGLLTRGIELDADALMVRATVLTYRWIDELRDVAHRTLGSVAGRAIGYLAPEIALGGAIVSAGLIETDALDREGVATYLGELAESNPDLLDHVTSGGGGLLDGLQMRSLLTAGVLAGDSGRLAAAGGLRAVGADPLATDFGAALRDVAGGFVGGPAEPADMPGAAASTAPRNIEALMAALAGARPSIHVERVAEHRYIAYLPGPDGGGRGLRLVGGDHLAYAGHVVRALEAAVAGDQGARVMLVGCGQGGVTAAEVAATAGSPAYTIEHVVTAGSPSAQVPRIPETTRVLSFEDRTDPVALLGSLVNANVTNRLTVVFEGAPGDEGVYVVGGRAADAAPHPELREEIERLVAAGFLVG